MALEVQFDGGSRGNPGPAAAGVVISNHHKKPLLEAGYYLGEMTNNQAEYNALLIALRAVRKTGEGRLTIRCDSELVVRQLLGQYRVKSPDLKPLYKRATAILDTLEQWSIHHVKRHLNARADALVNDALDAGADVTKLDLINTKRRSGGARPASRKRAGRKVPPVRVQVVRPPAVDACPACCKAGQTFLFTDTVPQDLCVDGCAAVIHGVLGLRAGTQVPGGETFTCNRKTCGATFTVQPAE